MPNPAVAMAGASIGGGVLQASAAKKAAGAQADAAKDSNAIQKYIYDNNVSLTEYQRDTGNNALAIMAGQMGIGDQPVFGSLGKQQFVQQGDDGRFNVQNNDGVVWQSFDTRAGANDFMDERRVGFEQSPGYQFRLDEGMKALERQQAARGSRLGGPAMKEAMRYGQGMAADEYGTYWNRLAGLAGAGQTATNSQVGAGQVYANAVGQNNRYAGDARASGYQNSANAWGGTINSLGGIYGGAMSGMYGPNPGFGIQPSQAGLNAWGWS